MAYIMYCCSNCTNQVDLNSNFCKYCGEKFINDDILENENMKSIKKVFSKRLYYNNDEVLIIDNINKSNSEIYTLDGKIKFSFNSYFDECERSNLKIEKFLNLLLKQFEKNLPVELHESESFCKLILQKKILITEDITHNKVYIKIIDLPNFTKIFDGEICKGPFLSNNDQFFDNNVLIENKNLDIYSLSSFDRIHFFTNRKFFMLYNNFIYLKINDIDNKLEKYSLNSFKLIDHLDFIPKNPRIVRNYLMYTVTINTGNYSSDNSIYQFNLDSNQLERKIFVGRTGSNKDNRKYYKTHFFNDIENYVYEIDDEYVSDYFIKNLKTNEIIKSFRCTSGIVLFNYIDNYLIKDIRTIYDLNEKFPDIKEYANPYRGLADNFSLYDNYLLIIDRDKNFISFDYKKGYYEKLYNCSKLYQHNFIFISIENITNNRYFQIKFRTRNLKIFYSCIFDIQEKQIISYKIRR